MTKTREERLAEALKSALDLLDSLGAAPQSPDRSEARELIAETEALQVEGRFAPVEQDGLYKLLLAGEADAEAQADAALWIKRFDDERRGMSRLDTKTISEAENLLEKLYNFMEAATSDSIEVAARYHPDNPLRQVLKFAKGE
jgi:hypothetical protein